MIRLLSPVPRYLPVPRKIYEKWRLTVSDRKRWLPTEKSRSSLEVTKEVITEKEGKYTENRKKGLSIRKQDGNEVKVCDMAQNILTAALNVKEVITTTVSFDPTGHGKFY
jgi:hypothetical protein